MTKPRHIHLIGICGTAMASLAGMLQERGFRVTGSDAAAYPPMSDLLHEMGVPVAQPYAEANLEPRPDLVVIGNGAKRTWLENEIAGEPWIHYLGTKFGRDSALYYKMADVFLLAGTAGLAVVESFAAGLPLLVTDLPTHPPEISYVVDGENGRVAPHEPEAFAASIVETLSDPGAMERLRRGAKESSARYTIEAMIDNYSTGIKKCLARYGSSPVMNGAELAAPGTESR